MAGLHILWLVAAYMCSLSGAITTGSGVVDMMMCDAFTSFPESMAVSSGTDVCFLCNYPGVENEHWSTSCGVDQDGMCMCTITDTSPGIQLCFSSFNSDCSGIYSCNVTMEQTGLVCSAEAEIVATDERFTEHPANVTAVQGNSVSFNCALISGSSVTWQRRNVPNTTFVTDDTPPGNYILGETNTLIIDGVQPDNAGEYRCAYEIQEGLYLYSDYGELEYLGEGLTLSLESTTYSLGEGSTAEVCITASGSIPESYSIDFSVVSYDVTAQSAVDYEVVNVSRTLVGIENPTCVESIPILTTSDQLVEANEQFSVSLTSSSFIVTISNSSLLVTIENDDGVILGIEQSSYTVEEGTELSVCLTYSGGELSGVNLTYEVQTVDGTATSLGVDYDPVDVLANISTVTNVTCAAMISVMINDDSIPETQQHFSIEIDSPDSFVTIANAAATIYIEDNDNLTIQFSRASYAFFEDAGTSSTIVNIVHDTRPEGFSVEYNVMSSDLTATEFEDYQPVNRNITITQTSDLTYCLLFSIISDSDVEGNETVSLQLSSSNPRVRLSTPTTIITIINDDNRVDIEFEQSAYTVNEYDGTVEVCATTLTTYDFLVTIATTVEDAELFSATGDDYSFSTSRLSLLAGETRVCTVATLAADDAFEGTESFYLIFSSSNPNIIFNANSRDGSSNRIRAQIFIIDNSGFIQMPQSVSAPLDSGSVEFNCSATVSLTFLVDGQNVSALPDSRGIASTISMMNDTVSGVVSVSVIEENNNTEVLCRLTNGELQSTSLPALLTITDTEFSGFVVGFERTGYTVEEGSGVVSVCLQVEFRNVFEQTQASVVVSTNNETATSLDFSDFSRLIDLDSQTSSTLCEDLVVVDDDLVEGTEELVVSLAIASGSVQINTQNNITVVILDNDYYNISWESSSYSLTEDSGGAMICANGSGTLQGNLRINLSTVTQDDTATEGLDYRPVTDVAEGVNRFCHQVAIISDFLVEGEEDFLLILQTDQEFVQLTAPTTARIIIQDANVFEVYFEEPSYTVSEAVGTLTVCLVHNVELSAEVAPGITIQISIREISADPLVGVAFELPTQPLLFNIEQSYDCSTLTVINDTTAHGDRSTLLGVMPNQSDISISINTTTSVTFLDEQVQTCGELFCMNGGECLDDFLCICPPEYTGSECNIRITQPTTLEIMAMTPVLGSAYQATCRLTVDSDVNLDETIGALVIQWLGPDGQPVNMTGVSVGAVMIADNTASLRLNFSSLTTSHVGYYTCRSNLFGPDTLQEQLSITFTLPAPTNVVISQLPFGNVTTGESISLTCASVITDSITSPVMTEVEWTMNDGESILDTQRFSISNTSALTPAIFVSTLTISPLLESDSGVYTCRVYLKSNAELSEFLSSSGAISTSYSLSVDVSSIPITLTTEYTSVPSVSPFNTFEFVCNAFPPDFLESYPFEFRWIREIGPGQQLPVVPDSTTQIDTSDTDPISVLTTTQSMPGQYVYYCEIEYQYNEGMVASASSISIGVSVTGPSNPAPPVNPTVYGTGVDFVVLQWTISRLEFTPETYYIEYTALSDDGPPPSDADITSVQYPFINTNFSTVNVEYTFVVNGLEASNVYGFKVVAVNSIGETKPLEYTYFQTRDEEPFNTPNDETEFTYPIGAPITLIFTHTDDPLDGSGSLTIGFTFLPESHTPLQQPQMTIILDSEGISARVEYGSASPSLTGVYVLCSQNDEPQLCGGRISLTVTVPSLSISTNLLVSQYVDGTVVNNMTPELVCQPSDLRAPVQWFTLPIFINLEQDYGAQFVPSDLNHTIRFPRFYERLPAGTLRVVCDLINVDEPGVMIDPMEATIIFIQNPVTLLNNDSELEPNAVINVFSIYEDVDYLSLICVGTEGSGGLVWEAAEVERFSGIIDDSVLSTNDDIAVEYYSSDRRDTGLVLQPITAATVGYYTCRSTESGYEARVLTTFQNPYFAFTNPTQYEVPLGVRVDLSARYAYWSNGQMNVGTGFRYTLTYLPCVVTPTVNPNDTTMPPPQVQLLDSGFTDAFSNNYVYSQYASENATGQYNLTFQYITTQEVYRQITEVVVTIPYIVMYEAQIVATRNQLVTISCIPNDLRAPVLWNIELIVRQVSDPLLHQYPQYFTFDPPTLRHRVTFNTSVIIQAFPVRYSGLFFNCGFMNGGDDVNIFNATSVMVVLQDDTIQLYHDFPDQRIYNNSVINYLNEEDIFTSPPPPLHKRDSPIQNSSLYVDCVASQGYHRPMWVTTNPLVGGATGVISMGDVYRAEMISDYIARLSFERFENAFSGVYMCISLKSSEFVEIVITDENPYVVAVSPAYVDVVEGDPVTLEFKVAVNSDGSSFENEPYFTFTSAFLDLEYMLTFQSRYPDFPQNYNHTIENVDRLQEGRYTATATRYSENEEEDFPNTAMAYITLNVTRRCPVEVNRGIQWQWTLEGNTVSRPCREAGSMFRAGPQASRRCNDQGEWEEADLTSCTLTEIEEPFLLLWFVIEADEITDDMKQGFIDSMEVLLDMNGVEYSQVSLQSVYFASVSLTFRIDLAVGDQTDNITQLSSFLSDTERFSSFNDYSVTEEGRGLVDISVAETCLCSSANLGSSLQLCSGAAISPCDCTDTVCTCQSPFVGDGVSCTLDSDSDGYPDQALDSPSCADDASLTYCIADVCPEVTNPDQDPLECEPDATVMQVFSGCPYGPDDVWAIIWPNTPGGSISSQPCPGGVDAVGTATRMCDENGVWGEPDVLSCQSLDILRVAQEADALLPGAGTAIVEVTPELIESAAVISEQLVMATESNVAVGLLPMDLNSTNNVVAQVLNVLESSVEEATTNEELVDVFNNILNETNQVGWTELQSIGSGSQTLLQNAERYGTYLASTVNETDQPVVLVRENIIVNAEAIDTSNVSDIVFPSRPEDLDNFTVVEMNDSAQITIPADAITRLTSENRSANLAVVHIIFRNIEDFLPANTSTLNNSRSASLVISSQFGGLDSVDILNDVFRENPITLNFSFSVNADVVTKYAGAFWNFSDPVGSGGWSSEGVQVISNITRGNVTMVLCNSTHLTSFAVLVDVAGGLEDITREEALALQIISYIGCIISTICLSITVVFYLAMGKKLFSAVHYFVHLNLALSLLLGYVVFMLGIELGTSSKGGCAFVAALLQYLFLSAFCWMMCEGVMLYLMLIVVFSKLKTKWWFFLILGYCTPLLFVVVGLAARSDYYGVRGDDGELSFCWLSTEKGTIFAFVAPMIIIIMINTVFLVLALATLARNKKQKVKAVNKNKSVKQAVTVLRATLILLPLLGLTWLFGLLTLNQNSTIFAWLFTVFNSMQGAAIFFFHVVRSEKVWSKISPRLSSMKQHTFKSSVKYNMSTSYSGSESSTSALKSTLLRKPPKDAALSSMTKESSQLSLSISESEVTIEVETDIDKKPLETIPEDREDMEHSTTAASSYVIRNPSISHEDGSNDEEEDQEEITRM